MSEVFQGTLTLADAIYGSDSQQASILVGAVEKARKSAWAIDVAFVGEVWPVVLGTLRAMKADVEGGLVNTRMA